MNITRIKRSMNSNSVIEVEIYDMENREKEYISLVIITLIHGIYTYCALGKLPHISLMVFSSIGIKAFLMWTIYSMCLYLVIQKWVMQSQNMKKQYLLSIFFGIVSALLKGGIDFLKAKLGDYLKSVIISACLDEATTVIFFVLLTCVLLFIIGKKKVHFNIKNVKVPLCLLVIWVVSYGVFVGNYLWQNQQAIKAFNANEQERFNLDYHFGRKILDGNVWFYIIFFLLFWWFMRRLTKEENEL